MFSVYCDNIDCPYRKNGMCDKEFIFLNRMGSCLHWWAPNGQPRPYMLDYAELSEETKREWENQKK